MTILQHLATFLFGPNDQRNVIVTKSSNKNHSNLPTIENDLNQDQPLHLPPYAGLERYKLLDKLGDGAFSIVYEALDLHSQEKKVAIKVIRKLDLNSGQRSKVLREVELMRSFQHDSIIALHDFVETDQFYFLILELCQGGELFHQIIHLTYFSEDLARHCIWQIAEGIRYLHEEKGVVHRDIKPENILFEPIPYMERNRAQVLQPQDDDAESPKVDEGGFLLNYGGGGIGKVKIADFGLSKCIWDQGTRTPCGTSDYLAPEIVRGEHYSKSVDMWALGCVLYTMLCGFPPFYDDSIDILTEKIVNGRYSFLSPWWDFISDDAKDLISHTLCLDPNDRFDIRQFMQHPWMTITQKPTCSSDEPSKPVGDILVPPSTTTSLAVETIAATRPWDIPNADRASGAGTSNAALFEATVSSMKELIDLSGQVHRKLEEGPERQKGRQTRLGLFLGFASNGNDSAADDTYTEYDNDSDDYDVYSIDDTPRDEITLANDDASTLDFHHDAIQYTPQYNKTMLASAIATANTSSSSSSSTRYPSHDSMHHRDSCPESNSFDDLTLVPTLTPDHSMQKRSHLSGQSDKHGRKSKKCHAPASAKKSFDLDLNKATLIGRRKERPSDLTPTMPLVRIN